MSHLAAVHKKIASTHGLHHAGRKHRKKVTLDTVLSKDEKEMARDILHKEGRLNACPSCGGIDLSIPPTEVDVLGGLLDSGKYYCIDCGYEGKPIGFKSEHIYEKFFHARRLKYNQGNRIEPSYLIVYPTTTSSHSAPYISALFSFVLPGLGQAYNGEKFKGACLAITFLLLEYTIFAVVNNPSGRLLDMFSLIAICFLIYVYGLFDAYFIASKKVGKYRAH